MHRKPKAKLAFMSLLEDAGLSQRALATFLGKDPVTVNRWCSARDDGLRVPQYARVFVSAFQRLPGTAKRELADSCGVQLSQ